MSPKPGIALAQTRASRLVILVVLILAASSTGSAEAQPLFSTGKVVGTHSEVSLPGSVQLADLDGDLDLDLLVAADNQTIWYPNQGDGSFGEYRRIADQASAGLVGDLDGDGLEDVLLARASGLEWYTNGGSGAFASREVIDASTGFLAVTIADFDGDQDQDIAALTETEKLIVFLNGGSGNFLRTSEIDAAGYYSIGVFIEAADTDQDGDTDLVLADYRSISWFENDGHGTLSATGQKLDLGSVRDLRSADLAGDIAPELLVSTDRGCNDCDDGLLIIRMDGTVAEVWKLEYPPEFAIPRAVAVTDVNGDGRVDLVASVVSTVADLTSHTTTQSSSLIWFEKAGGGSWLPIRTAAPSEYWADQLAVGDLNGDGSDDLVGISKTPGRVVAYLNSGDGTFRPELVTVPGTAGIMAMAVTDVDGDGENDLVAAGLGLGIYPGFGPDQPPEHTSFLYSAVGMAAGDFDADGDPDLVVGGDFWETFFENDGGGTFGRRDDRIRGYGIAEAWIKDLDLDGDPDLLTTGLCFFTCNWHYWHENDGAGSFTEHLIYNDLANTSAAADFDGDGDVDVVFSLGGSAGRDVLCRREGDDFSCSNVGGIGAFSIAPGDIDGDGDVDLAAASPSTGELAWLSNDGTGLFQRTKITDRPAWSVSLADLDGDQDLDMVAASGGSKYSLLIAFPNLDDPWPERSGFVVWLENLGGGVFGEPVQLAESDDDMIAHVADVDQDGRLDIVTAWPWSGRIEWFQNQTVAVGTTPDVALPSSLEVDGLHPNPFGHRASLAFSLPESARVTLEVFDLLGRRVTRPLYAQLPAGRHIAEIDSGAWTDGVYLYRLSAGTRTATGRLVRAR